MSPYATSLVMTMFNLRLYNLLGSGKLVSLPGFTG